MVSRRNHGANSTRSSITNASGICLHYPNLYYRGLGRCRLNDQDHEESSACVYYWKCYQPKVDNRSRRRKVLFAFRVNGVSYNERRQAPIDRLRHHELLLTAEKKQK